MTLMIVMLRMKIKLVKYLPINLKRSNQVCVSFYILRDDPG
jgi:hypothetical protein